MIRKIIALFATSLFLALPAWAEKMPPIKIGDIMSYTGWPANANLYRNGWKLAVDEINKAGGVLGRPLEIVSRDDRGNPSDVDLVVKDLVNDTDISAIIGGLASHVVLAMSQECLKQKIACVVPYGSSDRLLWETGHPYIFRVFPSTTVIGRMMFEQIKNSPKKRWAIVASQYETGHSLVDVFRKEIKQFRPDIEIVSEQWVPLKKIQAGSVINALKASKPEGIFLCVVPPDVQSFLREGERRSAFDGLEVVSYVLGRQDFGESYDSLPVGWKGISYDAGHHLDDLTPQHKAFVNAYHRTYNEYPDDASVRGYVAVKAVEAAIIKAGSTDREAVDKALIGLTFETPFGEVNFRPLDNQGSLGVWFGEAEKDDHGKTYMKDLLYLSGEPYWPRPDDHIPENLAKNKAGRK